MQMSFVPNAQVIRIKLFSDHFFRIRRFFAVSIRFPFYGKMLMSTSRLFAHYCIMTEANANRIDLKNVTHQVHHKIDAGPLLLSI